MIMRKLRTNKGFTLVEALFVVAIIVVLGSVVILSVVDYLRSMTKTEYDGYAKTVFVAAQNHLTMAEHEGYLGRKDFGKSDPSQTGVYYFVVQDGVSMTYDEANPDNSVLDLILPFGSIDETIRSGSYIIRYQKSSAKVLDVFYWNTDGRYAFNYSEAEGSDLTALLNAVADDKDNLRNFGDGAIIGYYGGSDVDQEPGDPMTAPQIKVVNAERLYVDVTKTTVDANQKTNIIIHGETSGATRILVIAHENEAFLQGDHYHIVLDDVADTDNNYHFNSINTDPKWQRDGNLIPGENITVQAVVYNENVYTNVAYSAKQTTNSLFADYYEVQGEGDEVHYTFGISNIRHLENLDPRVSNLGANADEEHALPFSAAEQTTDLNWSEFAKSIDEFNAAKVAVLDLEGVSSTVTGKGGFEPISPNYQLDYNGNNHTISDVVIDVNGNAGIFGAPEAALSVSNLKLQNFTVSGTSSSGALAGSLPLSSSVRNVVVYQGKGAAAESRVSTANGNAGGLIGEMQNTTVEGCAASVYVTSATGNAGGLIGKASGGSIVGSYSGGHTKGGAYVTVFDTEAGYTSEQPLVNNAFNVIAPSGSAGGLIGESDSTIQYCYSTCSADGSVAGGLIGNAKVTTGVGFADRSIKDCYSTGLVRGVKKGAFAGVLSGEGEVSGNYYFSIINWGTSAVYELADHASDDGISAFDAKTSVYQDFVSTGKTENPANPYDDTLAAYYHGNFNLKTVKQLGYVGTEELTPVDDEGGEGEEGGETESALKDLVDTHYGDWPAPEILIVNVPDAE